jgi:hypothetical protein
VAEFDSEKSAASFSTWLQTRQLFFPKAAYKKAASNNLDLIKVVVSSVIRRIGRIAHY